MITRYQSTSAKGGSGRTAGDFTVKASPVCSGVCSPFSALPLLSAPGSRIPSRVPFPSLPLSLSLFFLLGLSKPEVKTQERKCFQATVMCLCELWQPEDRQVWRSQFLRERELRVHGQVLGRSRHPRTELGEAGAI